MNQNIFQHNFRQRLHEELIKKRKQNVILLHVTWQLLWSHYALYTLSIISLYLFNIFWNMTAHCERSERDLMFLSKGIFFETWQRIASVASAISCFLVKGFSQSYQLIHIFCLLSEHLLLKWHKTTNGLFAIIVHQLFYYMHKTWIY